MLRTLRTRWLTPLGVCAAAGDGMRCSPLDMASSLMNGVARGRSGAGLARPSRHRRARAVSPDLTASHDHGKAARTAGTAGRVLVKSGHDRPLSSPRGGEGLAAPTLGHRDLAEAVA